MISITLKDGLWCPQFMCCACGEEIERLSDGSYSYHAKGPGEYSPPFITHTRCIDAHRARQPEARSWDTLPRLLQFLNNNHGQFFVIYERKPKVGHARRS